MADSCSFDMSPTVPLRDFNCYCEVTWERNLLGLRGRFETAEVTYKFVEELAKLPVAQQEQVFRRLTDSALNQLRFMAIQMKSSPIRSLTPAQQLRLDKLLELSQNFLPWTSRIIPTAREQVLRRQSLNPVGSWEWSGDLSPNDVKTDPGQVTARKLSVNGGSITPLTNGYRWSLGLDKAVTLTMTIAPIKRKNGIFTLSLRVLETDNSQFINYFQSQILVTLVDNRGATSGMKTAIQNDGKRIWLQSPLDQLETLERIEITVYSAFPNELVEITDLRISSEAGQ